MGTTYNVNHWKFEEGILIKPPNKHQANARDKLARFCHTLKIITSTRTIIFENNEPLIKHFAHIVADFLGRSQAENMANLWVKPLPLVGPHLKFLQIRICNLFHVYSLLVKYLVKIELC